MIKKWFISVITVVIFLWSVYSFYKFINKRQHQKKKGYINNCLNTLDRFNYSEKQKLNACSCRHEYLFSKYGDAIYNDNFIIPTKKDSLKVIDCLLKTNNYIKKLNSDSVLERIRKKND